MLFQGIASLGSGLGTVAGTATDAGSSRSLKLRIGIIVGKSATGRKVRKQLAKGVGILKVAKSLGIGTDTMQRISNELR